VLTPHEQHILLVAIDYYIDAGATDEDAVALQQVVDKLGLRPLEPGPGGATA
jgi:hypothetical protein